MKRKALLTALWLAVLVSSYLIVAPHAMAYRACQCTGYAHSRRPDLPSDLGNALTWAERARADRDGHRYSVGTRPSAGAIVVFQPGVRGAHSSYGHVAYVEYAYSENRYRISEKNVPIGSCSIHYRPIALERGRHRNGRPRMEFIYLPIRYGETKYGTITRSYTRDRFGFWGRAGEVVTIRLNKRGSFDPYLYLRAPSGRVEVSNDDGGGNLNSLIRSHRLQETGGYIIEAAGYRNRTGSYALTLERGSQASGNLARGRPVWASTVENYWHLPGYAVDGNMGTRWSSGHGGRNDWIYVDLGSDRDVSRIRIKWETAYASRYWILFWNPWDSTWRGWRVSSNGGWDEWYVGGYRRRWWAVLEAERPGPWANISIWEYELYGPDAGFANLQTQVESSVSDQQATSALAGVANLDLPVELTAGLAAEFSRALDADPELKAAMDKARVHAEKQSK